MTIINDAYSAILVLCSGEPNTDEHRQEHEGRIYEGIEFKMHEDYRELKNPDEPLINIYANNNGELTFVYVNREYNRVIVFAYFDGKEEQWEDHKNNLKKLGWE